MKILKRVMAVFAVCLVLLSMAVPAFAAPESDGVGTGVAQEVGTKTTAANLWNLPGMDEIMDVPSVTVDDLMEKGNRIGNQAVGLIQRVGVYVCVVFFILGIIGMVVGSKNPKVFPLSVFGTIVAMAGFVGILYYREILQFFTAWITSV